MDIELEVGQVWENKEDKGRTYEILKMFNCDDGFEWVCYFYQKNYSTSCNQRQVSNFTRNKTLITNADGKPYVKPNDYQHGDVWENPTRNSDLISFKTNSDGLLECRGVFDPNDIYEDSLTYTDDFKDFRLIYRDGKVVTND